MKRLLSYFLCLTVLVVAISASTAASADIRFGVMSNKGELDTIKKWTDITTYLTEKMGEPVKLVPVATADNIKAVENNEVDFLFTNPVLSAAINARFSPTLLATVNTKDGTQYGGAILVSKKSGITDVQGLKGKKVLTSIIGESAGANVFQHYYLKQKGIDVNKDFAMYKEVKNQDDIVLAVKSGAVDAGFARTGVLENLVKNGKMAMDDVIVLDKVADDFPMVHTTPLYPEWYLMAMKGTDAQKAEKVKQAVLALKPEDKASQSGEIKGFVAPLDLTEFTKVLQDLKIKPFDK